MIEQMKAVLDLDINPFKRKAKEAEQSGKRIIDTITLNGKKYNVVPKVVENLNNNLKQTEKISKTSSDSLSKGFDKSVGKIKKFGLALLSARSIYSVISKASSAYLSQDTQLANKLQAVWVGLGSMLAPIINTISNVLITGVKYINSFIKSLTGVDLLQKAISKSTKKTNANLKATNKTLASFDELTNLNQDSGSSGDTGTSWTDAFKDDKGFDIKAKIKEVINQIKDTLENTNWGELGQKVYDKVKTWITSINWGELATKIFTGLGEGLGAVVSVLGGFIVKLWDDISSYFGEWIKKSKEQGGNIVDGILAGIINGFVNIGIWLHDNVLVPFINGFKKVFGIASPSKVMKEMGGYIIDGLKDGIGNVWDKIKTGFNNIKENITTKFNDIKTAVKTKASEWATAIKDTFKWDNIKSSFDNIKNKIADALKSNGSIGKFFTTSYWKEKISNIKFPKIKLEITYDKNVSKTKLAVAKALGLDGFPKISISSYDVGTNYVPNDQLAMIHKGEAVVPKKFNSEEYFGRLGSNNEEVINAINNLNQTLVNKNMSVGISYKEVGQASTRYINEANRIQGKSVITI